MQKLGLISLVVSLTGGLAFCPAVADELGHSTPQSVRDVRIDELLGSYQHNPVRLYSDFGSILVEERDEQDVPTMLRWLNGAGQSWKLIPDLEAGVLRTDEENPHYASDPEDGRTFRLTRDRQQGEETTEDIVNFRFQGKLYEEVPDKNLKVLMTLARAKRHYSMEEYGQAFEILEAVIPQLENHHAYDHAKQMRTDCAVKLGKTSELSRDELFDLIKQKVPWEKWGLPFILAMGSGLLLIFVGLIFWTSKTRERGPGLMLSICWLGLVLLLPSLGFLLPAWSPGPASEAVSTWTGSILLAVVSLVAVWLGGRKRYLGERPLVAGFRSVWRMAGLLVLLYGGIAVLGHGYEILYQRITGQALEMQMVGLMLKAGTTFELLVILVVAGLLVPFYEEVVFRGFFFGALERRWGGTCALLVSSFVFAVAHGFVFLPVLLCIGLALGWLRLQTGDLRLSILLHAINNTMATLVYNFMM